MKADVPPGALDATARDFVTGQTVFGRYTLARVLGRGGMGIVWLAHDNELEREVALKFLPQLLILDRAMMADLKQETKRSLELTHKNIVRIHDFVSDETSACISMEYVDGDTLSNLRADRQNKVLETGELLKWTKQLCEALDYAHNHAHVVHRDLKPSNLMVNRRGDLKVADFGIARSLGDSVSMLTMGRRQSGTLVYMSPQQLDGELPSHLDDIYSLGATLYELLTSRPPFYSGNIDRQIHERTPPPMSHRRQEFEVESEPIDDKWEKLVAACLQKDPARRPQSAADIVQWLTALPPAPARKVGWFKFPRSDKPAPAVAKSHLPTADTFPPTTEIRPSADKAPRRIDLPQPPRPSKQRSRGAAFKALGVSIEKIFRTAGAAIVAGAKGAFKGFIAGIKAVLRWTEIAVLALAKETVRGVAITIIPAVVTAALVWFFATREPPKKIVAQPLTESSAVQPSQTQPIPGPIESRSANIAPSETSIQSPPSSGGQPSPPQDVLARAELPLNHLNASDVLDHIPGVLAAAPKATDFTWINRLVPNATHYASTEPATVTAHLDTGEAGVGQRVSLKIRVTGSKSAEVPETIDADGLEIRRTGSSTWFQMRNNVVNSGVTYDYAVVPLKLGTFRIPSQTIRTANASLVTPGLTLHVVGAPAGAAGIANSTVTRTSSDPFSNIELWSAFPRSMAGRHAVAWPGGSNTARFDGTWVGKDTGSSWTAVLTIHGETATMKLQSVKKLKPTETHWNNIPAPYNTNRALSFQWRAQAASVRSTETTIMIDWKEWKLTWQPSGIPYKVLQKNWRPPESGKFNVVYPPNRDWVFTANGSDLVAGKWTLHPER